MLLLVASEAPEDLQLMILLFIVANIQYYTLELLGGGGIPLCPSLCTKPYECTCNDVQIQITMM